MSTTTTIDSVKTAVNRTNTMVEGIYVDPAGTLNYFETDQAITDTPTLWMPMTASNGLPVDHFMLEEVSYYMDQTNAVTYQLLLLSASNADDVEQLRDLVWFSPAAQADATAYRYNNLGYCSDLAALTAEVIQYKLPVLVNLEETGKLYYMIDWSGAPGNTPGWIKIRGRLLK